MYVYMYIYVCVRVVTIYTQISTPYLVRVYTRIIFASRNSCPVIDPTSAGISMLTRRAGHAHVFA